MGGSIVLAAFDLILAVVPLKVALGLGKIDFWAFQRNNHASECQAYVHDYFFERLKNHFFHIQMKLLMVPLSWAYQKAAQNN